MHQIHFKPVDVLVGVAMLRDIRATQDLTTATIGAAVSTPGPTINQIINGRVCPTRAQKLRLLKVYGIPYDAWQTIVKPTDK
jgi:plasmid maintenance system antidote protein VapI